MCGGGGSYPTPEPVAKPQQTKTVTAAVAEARAQQQKTASRRTGYNATIMTGGLGEQNAATTSSKKLLGG